MEETREEEAGGCKERERRKKKMRKIKIEGGVGKEDKEGGRSKIYEG